MSLPNCFPHLHCRSLLRCLGEGGGVVKKYAEFGEKIREISEFLYYLQLIYIEE